MSYLGLEDSVDNDPCKFVLSCRGSAERFTLQAANVDIKQIWVGHIQEVLDAQSNFLSGEQNDTHKVLQSSWNLHKKLLYVKRWFKLILFHILLTHTSCWKV